MKRFRESGATYYPGTTVWGLEPHRVSCTMNGKAEELAASHIIVAPGGMERPVPFPGWTLPGVMGAGGADILLRSGGTLSADKNAPVVLAGNGPLLLLLAGHLLEAGVPIAAWLDTGWWSRRIMAGALMPAGVLDMPYVAKGMKMALRVLKGKVPIIRNVTISAPWDPIIWKRSCTRAARPTKSTPPPCCATRASSRARTSSIP
ncbi:MAG: hypothetical protein ACLSTO_03195 [Bilophila wadsworthia]